MAEYITVMREYERMCNSDMGCDNCQVSASNNGTGTSCYQFIRKSPEKAERIIMKWAEEHPVITNAMKFKEIFSYDFQDAFGALGCSEWLDDEYKKGKQYE